MVIPLERRGAKPVFRQIVDYLRRNIEGGRLPPGTKLQPIRLLAKELGVNRETVADAYRELEALGLTESGVGRGTFVLARQGVPGPERTMVAEVRPFVPVLSRTADATQALPNIDYGAPARAVRFERLVPDPSLFPADEFRRAVNAVLRRSGRTLFEYGDPRGHEGLRHVLVERLTASGVEADADDVVITSGSTQALALAARVFCDPGDPVVVEEPTYAGALASFTALGLRIVTVPMRPDGMDLHALDALLARLSPRLLYTMPTFHNPTGLTTALEHRRQLLEITARHGVATIEDDFEKDMRVRGRPVPPLKALDRAGQVVYVGTFSKALFPGVRVGWIVASRQIAAAAVALKRTSDLASSTVLQAALARFCRTGDYERHLKRARRELGTRLADAFAALDTHLPEGSTFTRPEGGFSTWITLPEPIDTLALLPAAKQAGVVYAPGSIFYSDGRRSASLRLSIGYARGADIERGVKALAEVTHAALPRRGARRAATAALSVQV